METTIAHSHKVELENRILYFDGDSTVSPDLLEDIITKTGHSNGLCVTDLSSEIKKYNSLVSEDERIIIKTDIRPNNLEWNIPTEYLDLDVKETIQIKYLEELERTEFTPYEKELREQRIEKELLMYEKLELFDVLRTLFYIINTFRHKNVVWGVGRGSSVASYILYLLGVHDVDSVKYELDIEEFLQIQP